MKQVGREGGRWTAGEAVGRQLGLGVDNGGKTNIFPCPCSVCTEAAL